MSNSTKKLKYVMCGSKSCCPVFTQIDDNKFEITDDYNGKVVLTKEELELLKTFLNKNLS